MAAGGYEAKAGQALRLLDIPITGAYGAWDELHGLASGQACLMPYAKVQPSIMAMQDGHL